jgi:hypothetical protein
LTSPNNRRAIAVPALSPGYQASRTAGTLAIHGIVTEPPVSSTTTVRGLAAATAAINASAPSSSVSEVRSSPSASVSRANTIATSLRAASAAARAGSSPASYCTSAFGTRAAIPASGEVGRAGHTSDDPPPDG